MQSLKLASATAGGVAFAQQDYASTFRAKVIGGQIYAEAQIGDNIISYNHSIDANFTFGSELTNTGTALGYDNGELFVSNIASLTDFPAFGKIEAGKINIEGRNFSGADGKQLFDVTGGELKITKANFSGFASASVKPIAVSDSGTVNFDNCTFNKNSATIISSGTGSSVVANSCTITQNSASIFAGTNVNLSACQIYGNTGTILGPNTNNLSLTDCNLYNNTGTILSLTGSTFYMTRGTIHDNQYDGENPILYLRGTVNISSIEFYNHTFSPILQGGDLEENNVPIYVDHASNITISGSQFYDNLSAIYATEEGENSIFTRNNIDEYVSNNIYRFLDRPCAAGLMHINESSQVTLKSVQISNCNSRYGAFIVANNSSLILDNKTEIYNCGYYQTRVNSAPKYLLTVQDDIIDVSGICGAVMLCSGSTLTIADASINHCYGRKGAIYCGGEDVAEGCKININTGAKLVNNIATNGEIFHTPTKDEFYGEQYAQWHDYNNSNIVNVQAQENRGIGWATSLKYYYNIGGIRPEQGFYRKFWDDHKKFMIEITYNSARNPENKYLFDPYLAITSESPWDSGDSEVLLSNLELFAKDEPYLEGNHPTNFMISENGSPVLTYYVGDFELTNSTRVKRYIIDTTNYVSQLDDGRNLSVLYYLPNVSGDSIFASEGNFLNDVSLKIFNMSYNRQGEEFYDQYSGGAISVSNYNQYFDETNLRTNISFINNGSITISNNISPTCGGAFNLRGNVYLITYVNNGRSISFDQNGVADIFIDDIAYINELFSSEENYVPNGGAIYLGKIDDYHPYNQASLQSCTFHKNYAYGGTGGAVALNDVPSGPAQIYFLYCTFDGYNTTSTTIDISGYFNVDAYQWTDEFNPEILRDEPIYNAVWGGAVAIKDSGEMYFNNCAFVNNSTSKGGSAILVIGYNSQPVVVFEQATYFVYNYGDINGYGYLVISNKAIVANDKATVTSVGNCPSDSVAFTSLNLKDNYFEGRGTVVLTGDNVIDNSVVSGVTFVLADGATLTILGNSKIVNEYGYCIDATMGRLFVADGVIVRGAVYDILANNNSMADLCNYLVKITDQTEIVADDATIEAPIVSQPAQAESASQTLMQGQIQTKKVQDVPSGDMVIRLDALIEDKKYWLKNNSNKVDYYFDNRTSKLTCPQKDFVEA